MRARIFMVLDQQQVNRRQFLRGGGARRWLRRRLTPRWWPAETNTRGGAIAPSARLLERISFPWLVVTLAICGLFALVSDWFPNWLLITVWLAIALGLAWSSDGSDRSGGGRPATPLLPRWTLLGRMTQSIRAAAGGIVFGAGLAVIVSVLLRFIASATIDIVSTARWAATAGLAIGLWRPSLILAFTAMLRRAAGRLRDRGFRS